VITLVALTVGSLLAAVASSLSLMIVARVIQGVGGGVLPLSFGLIRDEFPKEKVIGAIGVIAALAAAGAGLGIALAGPIVDALDYHWLFWFPMIVMALGAVAAHFVVPESEVRTPGMISWSGVILLSAWLVALILGISEAPTWGWSSTSVMGLLVVAVVLAILWVIVEARSRHPLIDMKMMRIPAVWTTNLVALLLGVGMYAVFAFLPEFLQTPSAAGYGFGVSITKSGLILLPMSIFMFAFGMLSGRLSKRFGSKSVLVIGLLVGIIAYALLTFAHSAQWQILLAMVILGVGFGLSFASMSTLVVVAVPPEQTGVASGMNANVRTIGGSIGAAVMSSIVTSGVRAGSYPRGSGYTHGFALLTLSAIAATIAAFFVPGMLRPPITVTEATVPHAELGMIAAGTLVGDESE
jgi:EmrB/QacA subfamily drug resistance transporter